MMTTKRGFGGQTEAGRGRVGGNGGGPKEQVLVMEDLRSLKVRLPRRTRLAQGQGAADI